MRLNHFKDGPLKYKCKKCVSSYSYHLDLKKHLHKKHRITLKYLDKNFATKDDWNKCLQIDQRFVKNRSVVENVDTFLKNSGKKFDCDKCGHQPTTRSRLNDHMRLKHNPDGPLKFKCPRCETYYSYHDKLKLHLNHKHGLSSKFLDREFNNESQRKKYLQVDRRVFCYFEGCNMVFHSDKEMENHVENYHLQVDKHTVSLDANKRTEQ